MPKRPKARATLQQPLPQIGRAAQHVQKRAVGEHLGLGALHHGHDAGLDWRSGKQAVQIPLQGLV